MDAWEATVSGPLRTRASGGKTARREPGASSDPIRSSGPGSWLRNKNQSVRPRHIIVPHRSLSLSSMLPWMLARSIARCSGVVCRSPGTLHQRDLHPRARSREVNSAHQHMPGQPHHTHAPVLRTCGARVRTDVGPLDPGEVEQKREIKGNRACHTMHRSRTPMRIATS